LLVGGLKANILMNEKRKLFSNFSKSSNYNARYPGVAFGMTLISGCKNPTNSPGFDQYKHRLLRRMRKRETLAQITGRIEVYDLFFRSFGYECPLPQHLRRTVLSGFPRYNLMVDAHFMAEMCAGILVAVTDFDRFDGNLSLDLAQEGEICHAMGKRDLRTEDGEIVLRDEKEIVCVLCQGADEKTRVMEDTRNVLFYAYAVPGIEGWHLKEGLTVAGEAVSEFGGGLLEGLEIF
jgi:DNA/RNA-binding domain of Phe-tRNA-synthetase-like protein